MKLKMALAALMLAAALALVACGDDDDDDGDGGGGGEPEAAAAALSIVATDQGIEAPESAEAGLVEVTLENRGKDAHEAQLIRLEGNHTVKDVIKVVSGEGQPIPEWMIGGGGVGTTAPGETGSATQALEPGTYAVIDSEADKPQTAEFEVTGEAAEAELPETEATVTASEYTFEASGLKAGSNTTTFENSGQELHHLIAIPAKADATLEQVTQFFKTEKGRPPFRGDEEDNVGTSVLDSGEAQVTELELTRGKYVFACFIQDRAGGPPHVAKGMITIEEIQ